MLVLLPTVTMDERTSNTLACLFFASSRNNGQIFLALRDYSSLVRCFTGLLRHGHVFEEERGQNDNSAEYENRYEAMLDGESERELERREHLVEQVLYLLHSLRSH
jgi:hypothetical protein